MTRAKDISKILTDADLSGTLDVAGNLSVDGGTIKLDGNYPTGTGNVALGNNALVNVAFSNYNTAIGTNALYSTTHPSGQNQGNTGVGYEALYSNTSVYNTAVGQQALYSNTTGNRNTAISGASLALNTTGSNNVAVGYTALYNNTTASNSTAVGYQALTANTTANSNTAVGFQALLSTTTGDQNVAIGKETLKNNTAATNTAVGEQSMKSTSTGAENSSLGQGSLYQNTTGGKNVAVGRLALYANTTANQNTAVGYQAGYSNTTSGDNTYFGYQAGYSRTGSGNTIIGQYAGRDGTTGANNTFIGRNSGYLVTSGSRNSILGMYNGNQGNLDIRTSSNNIVLSDGDGNPRGIFDSSGHFMVGKTTTNAFSDGVTLSAQGNNISRDSNTVLDIHRGGSDGNIIVFYAQSTQEGQISVSGTTVTYGGGHLGRWSRLLDNSKDATILKGTVMTNLNEMIEWSHEDVLWTDEDELPDGVSVGDVKKSAYTEDNEQLNKMAVSSVEGDVNVSGVFVSWDNDDDDYNDMIVAMTGDMVIRIAQGTTVARGDLLMSAGDGTAKPQGDDIVRSKTIAKVTSTNVSHTYDDGTYLVPCVLMAC